MLWKCYSFSIYELSDISHVTSSCQVNIVYARMSEETKYIQLIVKTKSSRAFLTAHKCNLTVCLAKFGKWSVWWQASVHFGSLMGKDKSAIGDDNDWGYDTIRSRTGAVFVLLLSFCCTSCRRNCATTEKRGIIVIKFVGKSGGAEVKFGVMLKFQRRANKNARFCCK